MSRREALLRRGDALDGRGVDGGLDVLWEHGSGRSCREGADGGGGQASGEAVHDVAGGAGGVGVAGHRDAVGVEMEVALDAEAAGEREFAHFVE